jgi:hypothetical protein
MTSTGVLYKHGPGCAGSGAHPVNGSFMNTAGNSQQRRSAFDDEKMSRLAAAEKLTQLLSVIIKNPNNLQAWIDFTLFPSCCLTVLGGRGDRKHQKALAGKLNEVIYAFPGRPVATMGLPCTNHAATAHKSYS